MFSPKKRICPLRIKSTTSSLRKSVSSNRLATACYWGKRCSRTGVSSGELTTSVQNRWSAREARIDRFRGDGVALPSALAQPYGRCSVDVKLRGASVKRECTDSYSRPRPGLQENHRHPRLPNLVADQRQKSRSRRALASESRAETSASNWRNARASNLLGVCTMKTCEYDHKVIQCKMSFL